MEHLELIQIRAGVEFQHLVVLQLILMGKELLEVVLVVLQLQRERYLMLQILALFMAPAL